MSNPIVIGAAAGVVLAFVALQFGVWGLVLALVLGAVGGVVGGAVTGRLHLRAAFDAVRGRRVG